MLIAKALGDTEELEVAMQALVGDLDSFRKKLNAGLLQDEATELRQRAQAILTSIKHLGQTIAFVGHDQND